MFCVPRFSWLLLAPIWLACSRTDPPPGDSGNPPLGGSGPADGCDADGDGHRALSCGGGDCDDTDPAFHPGALDANIRTGPWIIEQASAGVNGDLRAKPSIDVSAS